MLTIEGTVHHDNGQTTNYLIAPGEASWTQWGGTAAELGAARDYVHAMTLGLAEHSAYFQQAAADADTAPEQDTEADTPAAAAEPAGAPQAPPLVIPGEMADEETTAYSSYAHLADDYAMERYGLGMADLRESTVRKVEKNLRAMLALAPHLLPESERTKHGL